MPNRYAQWEFRSAARRAPPEKRLAQTVSYSKGGEPVLLPEGRQWLKLVIWARERH